MLDVSGAGYEPQGQFLCEGRPSSRSPQLGGSCRPPRWPPTRTSSREDADGRWHIKGDPTEGALVVAAAKAGWQKAELDAEFPRVDEIPFTSETKRMTTLHATPDGIVAYAKGAPEVILASCTRQRDRRAGRSAGRRAAGEAIAGDRPALAGQALRVLAVAREAAPPGRRPNAT